MFSPYDIRRLNELPVMLVAEALGLQVSRKKALCPFHPDRHPSLMFHPGKNLYRCFVCGAGGDCIDLVMRRLGLPFHEACRWLVRTFGLWMPEEERCRVAIRPVVPPVVPAAPVCPSGEDAAPDVAWLSGLVARPQLTTLARRFLFGERRLHPAVVRWLGVSSTDRSLRMSAGLSPFFNAPALLFPYRDCEGHLLSVQARYLGLSADKPRFQFPRGSRCPVFNLPVLRLLREGEPLFISEGVTDCMSLLSAGHKAIAIPSATLLRESDLERLRGLNLHIWPDADRPGERLFLQLREALSRLDTPLVRHQLPPGCKDFSEYYLSRLSEPRSSSPTP